MTLLSININKIATLRNARGGDLPNVLQVALDLETMGAEGITVHPRPDERHIRYQDVRDLRKHLHVPLNVEGYPDEEFLELVESVRPAQITLVPDRPDQLTSDAGWIFDAAQRKTLAQAIPRCKATGARLSLFVGTDLSAIREAQKTGADCIELYTGPWVQAHAQGHHAETIVPYQEAATLALELGLRVHAGHDLNLHNLRDLKAAIPALHEVSIGHAFIADSLYYGLAQTLFYYKKCLL